MVMTVWRKLKTAGHVTAGDRAEEARRLMLDS